MTVNEAVIDEAKKHGVDLSTSDAEYVLWEKTGYPSFFAPGPGETTEDALRRQVREWIDGGMKGDE